MRACVNTHLPRHKWLPRNFVRDSKCLKSPETFSGSTHMCLHTHKCFPTNICPLSSSPHMLWHLLLPPREPPPWVCTVGAVEKIQEEFALLRNLCPVTVRSRKAEVLHLRNLYGVTVRRWGRRGMKLLGRNAAIARTTWVYRRRP